MEIFLLMLILSLIIASVINELSLKVYFGMIDLGKHPYLKKTINDTLNKIARKEGIGVFDLSYDELNKDEKDEKKKACGVYVNLKKDDEFTEKIKKTYNDILEIEKKYGIPFHVMYEKEFKKPSSVRIYKFHFPRIEIAKDENPNRWTELYYFKTFAHELGHHFAIKNENNRSEERANEIGAKLILNHTPTYFRLIYGSLFDVVFDDKENKKKFGMPSGIKFWKLVWVYYWDYYRKKNKLNLTI